MIWDQLIDPFFRRLGDGTAARLRTRSSPPGGTQADDGRTHVRGDAGKAGCRGTALQPYGGVAAPPDGTSTPAPRSRRASGRSAWAARDARLRKTSTGVLGGQWAE